MSPLYLFRDDLSDVDNMKKTTDTAYIEIRSGPYENLIFRYGKITATEPKNDKENLILNITYDLHANYRNLEETLKDDSAFMDTLGEILKHIILQEKESHENRRPNNKEPVEGRKVS